ncbi:16S ribosomal RNA methyltransferase A [Halobacterium rubrum]|uniref:16S ribosomal RNA methyltransferase A n=1 Tax=Halobacterium TaxID=2239 RepID=UPI001F2FF5F5|nr:MULTISPECIES: 16S ribosomal RNA methyltransferase A [Halobacterium]MDH5019869.1 16S ribosomal RNA methyltransferase A [Halobacterium rubrum]
MTASRDPDALIRRAGRPDPEFDQHFLVDDRVLDRIPTYAERFDRSHVLEVGAGTGALTDRLLDVADRVTAVERDEDYAAFLREEFADEIAAGDLDVVQGDALDVDLPEFSCSVSNLPYGVSSEVTFRLLPEGEPMVLMYQLEFAERMAAEPGTSDYGRLSVAAQHYADVELVETVPPEAFDPQPRVESAVVRLTPREPDYEVGDEAFFLDFVKALFTQRRKTTRNAIRNTAHISGLERPDAVVDAVDEDVLRQRPGNLDPSAFAALANVALGVEGGGDP